MSGKIMWSDEPGECCTRHVAITWTSLWIALLIICWLATSLLGSIKPTCANAEHIHARRRRRQKKENIRWSQLRLKKVRRRLLSASHSANKEWQLLAVGRSLHLASRGGGRSVKRHTNAYTHSECRHRHTQQAQVKATIEERDREEEEVEVEGKWLLDT